VIRAAVVELGEVRKSYRTAAGHVEALGGITAAFAAGTFTAVMGPSGSGKSTLLHCAAGLGTVTSGQVRITGAALGGLSATALTLLRRSQIGFIFQAFNLIPSLTARQNVELPRRLAGRRAKRGEADAVLAAVGLAGHQRAVRRPAAARGHRAGAGHPAAGRLRRRADRRARLGRLPRRPRAAARPG
jgi:putative ABC transport system ATP-binding protein